MLADDIFFDEATMRNLRVTGMYQPFQGDMHPNWWCVDMHLDARVGGVGISSNM